MINILRKISFLRWLKKKCYSLLSPLFCRIYCKFSSVDKLKALARTYAHGYLKGNLSKTEESNLVIILNKLKKMNEVDESIKWCQEMFDKGSAPTSPLEAAPKELVSEKQFKNVIDPDEKQFDFFKLVKERRSVRTWIKKDVPTEALHQIIQVAIEAPCSCNRQSWKFLILSEKEKIEQISIFRGEKFLAAAPALVLIFCDVSLYPAIEKEYSPCMDAAVAAENILLAVQYLGLGGCLINAGKNSLVKTNRENLYKEFGIPAQYELMCMVAIGYPDRVNKKPARNPYEKYIINFHA